MVMTECVLQWRTPQEKEDGAGANAGAGVGLYPARCEVLLVRQPGPRGPGTVWALPGGQVDADELVVEALAREVREETGLQICGQPRLLCLGELANPTTIRLDAGEVPGPAETAIIIVYGVISFIGTLDHRADPDGEIAELS